jgi:predicted nucleotide-binding protein (sugar kinase/HSP70/actin superfamily)
MMKFAIFQVGDSAIATDAFARKVGIDVLTMPHPNKETISQGVSYAPDSTCFPFKVVLGTLMQALDKGAEVFILPKPKSVQACQSADFGIAQKYILEKTGRKFEIILLDSLKPNELLKKFQKYNPGLTSKKIAEGLLVVLQKFSLMDSLDKFYHGIYIATNKKTAQNFKARWLRVIDRTDSMVELFMLSSKIADDHKKYPAVDMDQVLKIAVIGDIYTLNEDVINNNIFERLSDLGVYSEKAISLKAFSGITLSLDPEDIVLTKRAREYMRHNVGAFAQDTIKNAIRYAEKGFHGLIHIYPFSCMPEITVRNILPKVSSDYDIPILYLPIDEQTGDAGFTTRVEAFVDLIQIRKKKDNFAVIQKR